MKKNVIIGALLLWNFVLMGVLIFVWTGSRTSSETTAGAAPAAVTSTNASEVQEFTFKTGDRLNSDVAPQIANCGLAIATTVDAQDQDGVIIAQGGLAHGYTLYVQNGELFFGARRDQVLTTVAGGKLGAGRHAIVALWKKNGELSLTVDGGPPATAQTAGAITVTPTDGLDVGSDRYAAVGPYQTPNPFGGTIEAVRLKTLP